MKTVIPFVVAGAVSLSGCSATIRHEVTDLTPRPVAVAEVPSAHPTLDTLPVAPAGSTFDRHPSIDLGRIEQDARAVLARSGAMAALDLVAEARAGVPLLAPENKALLALETKLVEEEAPRLAGLSGRLGEAQALTDRLAADLDGRMPERLTAIHVAVAVAGAERASRRGDGKAALAVIEEARARQQPDTPAWRDLTLAAGEVARRSGRSAEACRMAWELNPGGSIVVPADWRQMDRDSGVGRDLADAMAAFEDERDSEMALHLLARVRDRLDGACEDSQRTTAAMMTIALQSLQLDRFKALGNELSGSLGRDTPPPAIVPVLAVHRAMTGQPLPVGTAAELRESLRRAFPVVKRGPRG